MRNGSNNRRPRGRNNNHSNKGGNNRTQVFDSNGPEVRIRGTAHQISEKYDALAKDALSIGDRVVAESYFQHAEHYQRIVLEVNAQQAAREENKRAYENKNKNKSHESADGNKKEANNDDLALPASILGSAVEAKSEPVRELEEA